MDLKQVLKMHNITTIVVFIFLCHSLQFSDVEFGAKAPLQKKHKTKHPKNSPSHLFEYSSHFSFSKSKGFSPTQPRESVLNSSSLSS